MKLVFDKKDKKVLERVSNITEVDYLSSEDVKDLINALKDMIRVYELKENELEDLERNINENYEPKIVDLYEYYGVSERDFC